MNNRKAFFRRCIELDFYPSTNYISNNGVYSYRTREYYCKSCHRPYDKLNTTNICETRDCNSTFVKSPQELQSLKNNINFWKKLLILPLGLFAVGFGGNSLFASPFFGEGSFSNSYFTWIISAISLFFILAKLYEKSSKRKHILNHPDSLLKETVH